MSDGHTDALLPGDDPTAIELLVAVRAGDVGTIRRLLAEHPGMAGCRMVAKDGGTRTPLHLVADWPGYFPRGPEVVRLLIEGGADIEAQEGRSRAHLSPTPLATDAGTWHGSWSREAPGSRACGKQRRSETSPGLMSS